MSRDLTPKEMYLLEQQNIKDGYGSLWDNMEKTRYLDTRTGITAPLYSKEDLDLRKQFPVFGKFYHRFPELYDRMSDFNGGLSFLKEKDHELGLFIKTGKGDPDSYLVKWFEGTLDEGFHYRERNDSLLLQNICDEASLTLSNWIVTDPDCLQVRRQVGYEGRGIFQLMQVDVFDGDGPGDADRFCLAWAEIDIEDYSQKEINSTLNSYGYESFKDLVEAVGSRNEAYAQLAEMFFEEKSLEYHIQEFGTWNAALHEIEQRTGLNLSAFREIEDRDIDNLIRNAEHKKNNIKGLSGYGAKGLREGVAIGDD